MDKLEIKKCNHQSIDFQHLVKQLDEELKIRDGDDHDFYHQFNDIDSLNEVIIIYISNVPAACGAIKFFDSTTYEVKRMFTKTSHRGNRLATVVLEQLENWAKQLGATKLILETGVNQPEAIQLYKRYGFTRMANYAQYENVAASLCFQKKLSTHGNQGGL